MAKIKRVQVLMEPTEYGALEDIARRRGASVGELMRQAARVHLLGPVGVERRADAVRRFLRLPDTQMPEWTDLKAEIEEGRG